MSRIVIEGCAIATVDDDRTEHADGHIVIAGDRITAVGPGPAPAARTESDEHVVRIDGRGCLATPGLVNCHHHLYQSATRGLAADATLFQWLTELYPVWERIDDATVHTAARAGLASLALSGTSTSMDHHYVFPQGTADLLAAEIAAATEVGLRFHPTRGSMNLGRSDGGLPPDSLVEKHDDILTASAAAIDAFHDPDPGAMVRIALAPCSPFSVTGELMAETAELARARGVRLHTHLAETDDEDAFCLETFGCRPLEYIERLGWVGDDVWLAHCVHLDGDEAARMGAANMGVAHCPSSNARLGAGIAPIAALVEAGAPVGLGVDGAASNEASELHGELREALMLARLHGGPKAMTVRTALELGTRHGARCLGREDELGFLAPGALADIAVWRMDDLAGAGIADPVAALVLGRARTVEHLLVGGRPVVRDGQLVTVDAGHAARTLAAESRVLAQRAGLVR